MKRERKREREREREEKLPLESEGAGMEPTLLVRKRCCYSGRAMWLHGSRMKRIYKLEESYPEYRDRVKIERRRSLNTEE